jgi:predicted DNA-binding protein YlxM (UPF0122 family)
MYSISEISKMIGVSRQSIYKKIDKEGLQEYLIDGEKGKVVTDEGLDVLKGLFSEYLDSKPDTDNLQEKNSSTTDNLQADYIDSLKSDIEYLKGVISDERESLRDIISDQSQQITSLTRLLENSQVLLKQQQEKILFLESPPVKEKASFWSSIFNRQ